MTDISTIGPRELTVENLGRPGNGARQATAHLLLHTVKNG